MPEKDAKMDFRWRDEAGVEVEAYKVTKGARWASQDWPEWLQIQGNARDLNKVYTDAADPNRLFISLESGRFGLEDNAYVIYENGGLKVQSSAIFEQQFNKVVPIPPRVLDEESLAGFESSHRVEDGKLVKLSADEVAALPPEKPTLSVVEPVTKLQVSNLRPKAEIALELMIEGDTSSAQKVLKQALSDETQWCSCVPGSCDGGPRWGCRQNSPLVK